MKRLRCSSLIDCIYLKRLEPKKDAEGNIIPVFANVNDIKAEIWPAASQLQIEMYGQRIVNIQNMLYKGNEKINIGDHIVFENKLYNVISAKGKGIRIIEIEAI